MKPAQSANFYSPCFQVWRFQLLLYQYQFLRVRRPVPQHPEVPGGSLRLRAQVHHHHQEAAAGLVPDRGQRAAVGEQDTRPARGIPDGQGEDRRVWSSSTDTRGRGHHGGDEDPHHNSNRDQHRVDQHHHKEDDDHHHHQPGPWPVQPGESLRRPLSAGDLPGDSWHPRGGPGTPLPPCGLQEPRLELDGGRGDRHPALSSWHHRPR